MTLHFGIIGNPLDHSYSAKWFNRQFRLNRIDAVYRNYQLDNLSNIREFISQHQLTGINVTSPFKTEIIPFLDRLTPIAQTIGAVNVVYNQNGQLIGHNTDCIGFQKSLAPLLTAQQTHQALVLGTGGAAKAVCQALCNMTIPYQIVSRQNQPHTITYEQISEQIMAQYNIIVNCTPLGMEPYRLKCPDIPYNMINNHHLLFDLIYNPSPSLFLKKGAEQGATISDGLNMLVYQAQEAWKFFEL